MATALVHFDSEVDLAVVQVPGLALPPLPLADTNTASIGDTVYAVGSPLGLDGTFSSGIVSGVRDVEGTRLLQITAPISPGSSGGPVLDVRGQVLGIAVGTFTDGQNLNFAIPADALQRLLDGSAEPRPISSLEDERADPGGSDAGGLPVSAVVELGALLLDGGGAFSFSVRNLLDRPIRDVILILAFHDHTGFPLDTVRVRVHDVILPMLGVRATGSVDPSVERILRQAPSGAAPSSPLTYVVLGFEFATDEEARRETVVVRPGDSLWSLARRHGVSVAELMEANDLVNDDVRPGQVLRLP